LKNGRRSRRRTRSSRRRRRTWRSRRGDGGCRRRCNGERNSRTVKRIRGLEARFLFEFSRSRPRNRLDLVIFIRRHIEVA
jgi:hypothetical protein